MPFYFWPKPTKLSFGSPWEFSVLWRRETRTGHTNWLDAFWAEFVSLCTEETGIRKIITRETCFSQVQCVDIWEPLFLIQEKVSVEKSWTASNRDHKSFIFNQLQLDKTILEEERAKKKNLEYYFFTHWPAERGTFGAMPGTFSSFSLCHMFLFLLSFFRWKYWTFFLNNFQEKQMQGISAVNGRQLRKFCGDWTCKQLKLLLNCFSHWFWRYIWV